jgi:Protein of unknown function (DUF1566)
MMKTQLSIRARLHIRFGLSAAVAGFAVAANAVNDTGTTLCYNDTGSIACNAATISDTGTHPRQDGRLGRDVATISKVGGGAAGFDFSKISNAGLVVAAATPLGSAPSDWACTLDNVTGLWWEVKTENLMTPGNRDVNNSYTWYDSNAATNGGDAGNTGNSTSCFGTLTQCNSATYIAAVNSTALCGRSDWRLPSYKEAMSIYNAAIATTTSPNDPTYFLNRGYGALTSNTMPALNGSVFFLDTAGGMRASLKTTARPIRLVAGTNAYQ